jgi:amino-acid N-acetyltransferase
MDPIDLPPKRKDMDGQDLFHAEDNGRELGNFLIRKARITDVKDIMNLINGFAAANFVLPRGPQYIYENIRDFVVAVRPDPNHTQQSQEQETAEKPLLILGCGSLHVLWEDLAEVRSLAVLARYQKQGLGRRMIDYMKEEARGLGIKKLFAFTLAEGFFQALGFEPKGTQELPAKVWGECSRCPKYFKCDEVGMILDL